ncbi:MAG: ABC transporter substrate-binding protein [Planctomycetota bacterium]
MSLPRFELAQRTRRRRVGDTWRDTRFFSRLALPLLVLAACGEPPPWHAADWRPPQPPQRVVLASVLAAETLLEVLPHERIAGVHAFAANAEYSLAAMHVGDLRLLGATPEELLAVRPDLVLVDAYTSADTLALLSAASVPVLRTLDPHSFADIEANMRLLGELAHCEPAVASCMQDVQGRLERVRQLAPQLAGWRVLSFDGALHSYGIGSLFHELAEAAGLRNLAAEHGVGSYRKLDVEEVLAWRPDALVLAGDPGDGMPEWLRQYPGLDLLPCVRNGRVLVVPRSMLTTTSHHLVGAAEYVQQAMLKWGKP